ncbi:MAG: hypothetical protein SF187_02310 [Deltaproteobacteria bacterium]|nr:hypothetical protein [Deltaproteobacteria bacterium]
MTTHVERVAEHPTRVRRNFHIARAVEWRHGTRRVGAFNVEGHLDEVYRQRDRFVTDEIVDDSRNEIRLSINSPGLPGLELGGALVYTVLLSGTLEEELPTATRVMEASARLVATEESNPVHEVRLRVHRIAVNPVASEASEMPSVEFHWHSHGTIIATPKGAAPIWFRERPGRTPSQSLIEVDFPDQTSSAHQTYLVRAFIIAHTLFGLRP